MEFRLVGQNDRHFLNPFSGFENRQNSRVSEKTLPPKSIP